MKGEISVAKREKVTDSLVVNMLRTNGYIDGNFKSLKKDVFVWANRSENKIIDSYNLSLTKTRLKNIEILQYGDSAVG